MPEATGLSVGATNMAGVVDGRTAVIRQSVLTLYRHRPPAPHGFFEHYQAKAGQVDHRAGQDQE